MGFLIRTGFWFSMTLLALPAGFAGSGGEEQVGPLQAIFAAKEAVSDVTGICQRKPDVCETGRVAASTIAVRAQESARLAMDMMDSEEAKQGIAALDALALLDPTAKTGSVPIPTPRASVASAD